MEFRPHKYQDYAREFIIGHPVCALILDMGLGKTVITLTALWELALDYFEVGKVLVIAPFRVARDTWKEELEKWDHLKGLSVSVVVGSEKERFCHLKMGTWMRSMQLLFPGNYCRWQMEQSMMRTTKSAISTIRNWMLWRI